MQTKRFLRSILYLENCNLDLAHLKILVINVKKTLKSALAKAVKRTHQFFQQHLIKNEEQNGKRYSVYLG